MTAREYARVSGTITEEQDALRDKLSQTQDSVAVATITGKIDGLETARKILRAAVL